MRILFLGDIVGRDGRDIVFRHLSQLQKQYAIDFTIANAENSAHGKGISIRIYEELIAHGVDVITMGNHTYSKSEIKNHLSKMDQMVQPYNHALQLHQGYKITEVNGSRLCVVNLLGGVFMNENHQDVFLAMQDILDNTDADLYFVDLHAEATSEKILFANYFKSDLIAVIGTHTHVQTADERLIGNLAYLSDAGMCGTFDSIIGRDVDEMIANILHKEKTHYTIASGPAILCGCVIEIDEKNRRAVSIKRIQIRPEDEQLCRI